MRDKKIIGAKKVAEAKGTDKMLKYFKPEIRKKILLYIRLIRCIAFLFIAVFISSPTWGYIIIYRTLYESGNFFLWTAGFILMQAMLISGLITYLHNR